MIKSFKYYTGELRHWQTRMVAAYERARYGWSKWDIRGPGFDCSVGVAIGKQLLYFADQTMGFPGREPYETYEKWTADIRKHGKALSTVDVEMPAEYSNYLDKMYTENGFVTFPEMTEIVKKVKDDYRAKEIQAYENRKQAYIWLSEWAGSLWD